MEKLTVVIRKSKNVHAWSNAYIGQYIEVETGHFGYDRGYKVVFENNSHIEVSHNMIAGIIFECDCHVVAKEVIA